MEQHLIYSTAGRRRQTMVLLSAPPEQLRPLGRWRGALLSSQVTAREPRWGPELTDAHAGRGEGVKQTPQELELLSLPAGNARGRPWLLAALRQTAPRGPGSAGGG